MDNINIYLRNNIILFPVSNPIRKNELAKNFNNATFYNCGACTKSNIITTRI